MFHFFFVETASVEEEEALQVMCPYTVGLYMIGGCRSKNDLILILKYTYETSDSFLRGGSSPSGAHTAPLESNRLWQTLL